MSLQTNSLAETQNSNQTIEEASEYIIVKDGYGVDHKVVNLENPKIVRKEGLIILTPTRSSNRHAQQIRYTKWTDPMTGVHYGIFTGVNPKTKELMFQSIFLKNEVTFDLSNQMDAKRWAIIQYAPFLQSSPNFKSGQKTQYKVVDKDQEAVEFLAKRTVKRKAVDIAEGLVGESLVDAARDLGLDPKSYSIPTLHAEVIKIAEENFKRFMDMWDNPARSQFTIFKRGLATGVIFRDVSGFGYMFGAHPLGATEGAAVDYLRQNERLSMAIDQQARAKEHDSVKAMASKKMETAPKTGDDARFQALMAELEAQKELTKNLSEQLQKKEFDSTGTISADEELMELRKEAKTLGVKNPAVYGKEKLIAEIAKRKLEKV